MSKSLKDIEAIAFEGGGVMGLAYLPIIKEILTESKINRISGTSAGAITAMLLSIGLSYEKIKEIQIHTPWKKFAKYKFSMLWRFLKTKGIYDLNFAKEWIENVLDNSKYNKDIRFKDLDIELFIVATRYKLYRYSSADAEPFIFSKENTPDVKIVDAILASMAIPFFFEYKKIGEYYFCDGGIAMNHPLSIFRNLEKDKILGVRVDNSIEFKKLEENIDQSFGPSIKDIVIANTKMLRRIANNQYVPEELWDRVIRIDVGEQSALDFDISPEDIELLIKAGERSLEEWKIKYE